MRFIESERRGDRFLINADKFRHVEVGRLRVLGLVHKRPPREDVDARFGQLLLDDVRGRSFFDEVGDQIGGVVDPRCQCRCCHTFARLDDTADLQLFALGHQLLQEGGVTTLVRPHPIGLVEDVVVRRVDHLERHVHDLPVGERLGTALRRDDWFIVNQLRDHRVQLRWVAQVHRVQNEVTNATTGGEDEDGFVIGLGPITSNNVILLLDQGGVIHHFNKSIGIHCGVHQAPTASCPSEAKRGKR